MCNRTRSLTALILALSVAALASAFPTTRPTVPQETLPPVIPATTQAPTTEVPPTTAAPPTLVLPTFTPPPTATATATALPCDRAAFVTDVTDPDGSDFYPGQTLTKTWRLRNNGTCTWTSGYSLIFDHGDAMGAPASQQLTTGTVAPGQSIDVSVNLTAPGAVGTYRGYFRLRNPSGVVFGIGANADVAFWAEIEVVPGTITLLFNPDWLVPIFPLLPTADFSLAYANVHICGVDRVIAFRLGNDDDVTFESVRLSMSDSTAGVLYVGVSSDSFANSATSGGMTASSFPTGGNRYVIRSLSPGSVSGNSFSATVRACSENGMGGTCVDHTINFSLP